MYNFPELPFLEGLSLNYTQEKPRMKTYMALMPAKTVDLSKPKKAKRRGFNND